MEALVVVMSSWLIWLSFSVEVNRADALFGFGLAVLALCLLRFFPSSGQLLPEVLSGLLPVLSGSTFVKQFFCL